MRTLLFTSLMILLVASANTGCKKKIRAQSVIKMEETDTAYYIEDFREPGMSDQEMIQAACDSVPENATLIFNNRVYDIDHTIFLYKSLHLKGPATLRRENQFTYKLAAAANPADNKLELNTTLGLKATDYFLLTTGAKDSRATTSMNLVTSIDGNTVTTFYPIGNFLDSASDIKEGSCFFKDVKFFWIMNPDPSIFPTQSCSFTDLTFEGNRYFNQGTYSWYLHNAILASSKGKTVIDNCVFTNSPGESVVGHNLYIHNSTFMNLNGSAIHTSIDRLHVNENEIHSEFTNNVFENTNEIPTKTGGHSEGCITHSNSGGYYTAKDNTFINVGEAVIGLLYPSVSQNDWGTSDILVTDNIIKTPGRMVYSFGILDGKLENVRVIDNKIFEINPWDWSDALAHYPDVIIENTVNQ